MFCRSLEAVLDDCREGPLSDTTGNAVARSSHLAGLSALGLSALGVVFGDIGTSPLYTLKTVRSLTGGTPDAAVTLGVLSHGICALIVVTSIRYLLIVMHVHKVGEEGILAVLAL